VTRQRGLLDRYRRWDIFLDGTVVGSIRNGQCHNVQVASGKHSIRVGHRWLSSPIRSFVIRRSDTVDFICRPRPHPMIWIPYGVASLVRNDLFIVLEPVDDLGLIRVDA